MNQKLYHPRWRIIFVIGFIAFLSSYLFKVLNVDEPRYWSVVKYVIGYGAAGFAIIQVLLSTIIRKGEKITWYISLLFLAPLGLLLYCIVYKRIHGFYLHPSKNLKPAKHI